MNKRLRFSIRVIGIGIIVVGYLAAANYYEHHRRKAVSNLRGDLLEVISQPLPANESYSVEQELKQLRGQRRLMRKYTSANFSEREIITERLE